MNLASIPSVEAPISVHSLPTPNVGNVSSAVTGKVSAVAGGLSKGIPSVSLPSVPALPSMPKLPTVSLPSTPAIGGVTDKLKSLTRGALPTPKLGLDGLKSSAMGSVNVDSLIGDMKPSLAGNLVGKAVSAKQSVTDTISNSTSVVTKQIQSAQSAASSATGQISGATTDVSSTAESTASNVDKNITQTFTV